MEKLRIVLCDANVREMEYYADICRGICAINNIPAELKLYSNSHDLLFDLKDDAFSALVSIVVIDPAGDFAGIPAAMRGDGYDGLIFYLSHSTVPEQYHQAFDADAYNYAQKGGDYNSLLRFQMTFKESLQAARKLERQYIAVSCAGEYRQIEIRDIYYFEAAMEHMIKVEYRGGSFRFPSTLQRLEERLRGRGFVRTHRSYIVAIHAVRRLEPNEVVLSDGSEVPVSRSYYAALKSAMDRWEL